MSERRYPSAEDCRGIVASSGAPGASDAAASAGNAVNGTRDRQADPKGAVSVSRRVLIVEDELLVAMDIQDSLEAIGLDPVGPCTSIVEAMAALDAMLPDCAILDVQLFDGEVFPVADRLGRLGVPIVFHSGHADQKALSDRYANTRFCSKPCAPSVLEREVLRAMEGPADAPADHPPRGM